MKFLLLAVICLACAVPIFSQRRQGQQSCVTPENYYGTCVALNYCPQVANIFQQTNQQTARQYLFSLQRSCGTRSINGDPVVCCTRPLTNERPTTRPVNPFFSSTTSRNPQTSNPFFSTRPVEVTTIGTTSTTRSAPTLAPTIDNRGTQCRDPNLRDGVCIALESCPELVNELYAKQGDSNFANFLRASNRVCGGTGSMVCCPSGTAPKPVTSSPIIANSGGIPRRLPTVQEGCGHTDHSFRKIVGGEVSQKGAWPWIALLGYDAELSNSPFKCGGTLVTARHVLTAAHCILRDLSFVRLGEHDLSTDAEARHVDVRVVRSEAHPDYNRRNGHSDIAILYLESNVQFTGAISPICMPITPELRQKSYIKHTPFVAGWGKTMEGGVSATVLQELQIPILTNNECAASYQAQNRLFSANQFDAAVICAGVKSGGKDTCQGDSGGPLMIPEQYQNNVRFYLIGIVSYGIGCARADVPGVYTSTQYFMDWIIQKIADTS